MAKTGAISMLMPLLLRLRVDESSENRNGGSEGVDGLDRRVEDDDGGDNDGDPLHGVADAECQW